ncbi:MAG TPA: hypothetical protein VFV50_09675, partial [Bdellovibrionales bacterium]|nr:hypothetical protein [Bdellovibrionales bacterium]
MSRSLVTLKRALSVLAAAALIGGCQWAQTLIFGEPHDLKSRETLAKTKPGSKEALTAAREGAHIAFLEVKDYRRALFFYKYLVLYSDDEAERLEAQKHLAEIYFERLTDYDQAVIEYNRLLQLPHDPKENAHFRMNVAKSYFYLNKFAQADAELDIVVRGNPTGQVFFDANLLRA